MASGKKNDTLYITDHTIKYSGQTYQLSNITQVGKYKLKRSRFAKIIFALILGGAGVAIAQQRGGEPVGVALICAGLLLLIYALIRRSQYLLRLETNSGSAELFSSKDEAFIDDLIDTISEVMDNKTEGTNIIAYTDKSKIIDNSSSKVVMGDEVGGDKFQDVKESQIINRSTNAAITNIISDRYGEAVQRELQNLSKHIAEHNDPGASALLEKIIEELQAQSVDKPKVTALWETLVKVLPEVSKVAASIATIAAAIL